MTDLDQLHVATVGLTVGLVSSLLTSFAWYLTWRRR